VRLHEAPLRLLGLFTLQPLEVPAERDPRNIERARRLFARARDLDIIRFRAPGEFREIIKSVAKKTGAHYVPSEEAFDSAAQYGIPGQDLFLEHVHPNAGGYLLLGRIYFEALQHAEFLGRADLGRLASWDEYARRMDLTALDNRTVYHTVKTITTRWPFLPVNAQQNYRGTYQPTDFTDSVAFAVSMGVTTWAQAKLETARRFEARGQVDSALAEYGGLIRREPHSEQDITPAGAALLDGSSRSARAHSWRNPTLSSRLHLPLMRLGPRQTIWRRAARSHFSSNRCRSPNTPATLYQLSITYAVAHDMGHARAPRRGWQRKSGIRASSLASALAWAANERMAGSSACIRVCIRRLLAALIGLAPLIHREVYVSSRWA
jgi:hypothetical protein